MTTCTAYIGIMLVALEIYLTKLNNCKAYMLVNPMQHDLYTLLLRLLTGI